MKRGPHQRENKQLSKEGLISQLQQIFHRIAKKIEKKKRAGSITLPDCLMSAFAMFNLKSPSLLAFDNDSRKEPLCTNLKTLYGIREVPCDTYMREILDEVDPREIRPAFTTIFSQLQRAKLLEGYRFIDDGYLISVDGTDMFQSQKVSCENCCEKHCTNGTTVYYHQVLAGAIVHPRKKQVIPLCVEPIQKQDGVSKNDCETNAANRFFDDLKREHPRLRLTCVLDALFATAPFINGLVKRGFGYMIRAKKGNNKTFFEWIENGEVKLKTIKIVKGKNIYEFRYANKIPLNTTKNAPFVNFLECKATEIKGRQIVVKNFRWFTSHEITDYNIYDLMEGGRARWKIENETFNTLKNQGYQFEHNFGHGKKNLNTVFAMLMFLSFLIDQVQEASDGLFQLALAKHKTRRIIWEDIRSFFRLAILSSWDHVFRALAFGFKPFELDLNTC